MPASSKAAALLVTAGGTQEPIDPVRYISNRSSGLMGYLIAEEAARRGGKVIARHGSDDAPHTGRARDREGEDRPGDARSRLGSGRCGRCRHQGRGGRRLLAGYVGGPQAEEGRWAPPTSFSSPRPTSSPSSVPHAIS